MSAAALAVGGRSGREVTAAEDAGSDDLLLLAVSSDGPSLLLPSPPLSSGSPAHLPTSPKTIYSVFPSPVSEKDDSIDRDPSDHVLCTAEEHLLQDIIAEFLHGGADEAAALEAPGEDDDNDHASMADAKDGEGGEKTKEEPAAEEPSSGGARRRSQRLVDKKRSSEEPVDVKLGRRRSRKRSSPSASEEATEGKRRSDLLDQDPDREDRDGEDDRGRTRVMVPGGES